MKQLGEEQVAAPRGGGSAKWIVAACCGCMALAMLLAGLGGGALFFKIREALAGYEAEAMAFLEKAAAGDVEGAYGHFSAGLRRAQSLEELAASIEANPDLFQAASMSLTSVNVDGVTGISRVSGTVTSRSGVTRHCLFAFVEEDGQRRLIEYSISNTPSD
ncbi:MAG: hypothetical protein KIT58_17680 [Planctomycetota bacterium]|nr:hypothetical protein [Planctomycetota bacterium]